MIPPPTPDALALAIGWMPAYHRQSPQFPRHSPVAEGCAQISVAAALRKATQLLQQGHIDVRICTPRGQVQLQDELNCLEEQEKTDMTSKGERRGTRETKKPKKEKIKVIAAAPSQKAAGWQPGFASGKKK
ncbi:hypothetical protein [Bradyrhizobium sp. LTSPM299]|uniref:hypothetical protein n=1 Tax=Bradyrhizobium sp. LTSPM299 TaxID=1619233 RepID=UPI0012E1E08B|nr:hypothetical protein [Bradyrhizobium sp. LTSPM299]